MKKGRAVNRQRSMVAIPDFPPIYPSSTLSPSISHPANLPSLPPSPSFENHLRSIPLSHSLPPPPPSSRQFGSTPTSVSFSLSSTFILPPSITHLAHPSHSPQKTDQPVSTLGLAHLEPYPPYSPRCYCTTPCHSPLSLSLSFPSLPLALFSLPLDVFVHTPPAPLPVFFPSCLFLPSAVVSPGSSCHRHCRRHRHRHRLLL